jgi:predicted SnoaL-like aldol condensation-catalyzing enzyme
LNQRGDSPKDADDAVLIHQKQIYRGKDGAREMFTKVLSDVPQGQLKLETVFADDVLYLEWQATGRGYHVADGVDTFIFRDGMISLQTVVYHVQAA